MKTKRLFRPDFIVALLAVIIGLCTMIVYIYQAKIMSKQLHASSWPYLETNFSQGADGVSLTVTNKGIGPAIVKQAFLVVDNSSFSDSRENIDSAAFILTGSKELLNGYTSLKSRVISPGEVIKFIEITDSSRVKLLMKSLAGHSVKIELCYCSVFDECWRISGGKMEACNDCN